ncbi:MAG: hypothetical protein ACO3A2_08800 [Bdellovibrionia bacterium]
MKKIPGSSVTSGDGLREVLSSPEMGIGKNQGALGEDKNPKSNGRIN